ncbi:MAG: type II toxin-antitoxin system prevent-host-death family antitoxin [Gemmatimonadaceae bacterium]|nr:type II toxin-antitoxin system prevent-host-death family antitoxin [Gemmatimonadaceae bacterium]
MPDEYSIYEAKAKLSAIVRMVREGHSAIITVHGEPVAEIRPIEKKPETFEERYARLKAEGKIIPARNRNAEFKPVGHRPGALQRFLDERE